MSTSAHTCRARFESTSPKRNCRSKLDVFALAGSCCVFGQRTAVDKATTYAWEQRRTNPYECGSRAQLFHAPDVSNVDQPQSCQRKQGGTASEAAHRESERAGTTDVHASGWAAAHGWGWWGATSTDVAQGEHAVDYQHGTSMLAAAAM